MVKSCGVVGGGLLDYTVSFLGQAIVISISRPRSLTISIFIPSCKPFVSFDPNLTLSHCEVSCQEREFLKLSICFFSFILSDLLPLTHKSGFGPVKSLTTIFISVTMSIVGQNIQKVSIKIISFLSKSAMILNGEISASHTIL